MKILSNGMESTLANWREFARLAWSDSSAAVIFIDNQIAEKGDSFEVTTPENQMRMLLSTIHDHDLSEKNSLRTPDLEVVKVAL